MALKRKFSEMFPNKIVRTVTPDYISTVSSQLNKMPYVAKKNKASRRTFKKRSGQSFNARVKEVIFKASETKFIQATTVENLVTQGLAPLYYDWPSIATGVNTTNRIGNKICCMNLGFKTLYNNNSTTLSTYVREVLLEVDGGRYNSNTDITNALFEGAVDTTWAGDLSDMVNRIQKDGIKVLSDKTYNLAANAVAAFDAGQAGNTWYRSMRKTLTHRDQTTTQPTNKRYTLMILARDPANDGTVAAGTEATVHRNMSFKDM